MGSFGKAAELLVAGIVGIGMATALFLPGRQTAAVTSAGFKGAQGLLGTAISGKG